MDNTIVMPLAFMSVETRRRRKEQKDRIRNALATSKPFIDAKRKSVSKSGQEFRVRFEEDLGADVLVSDDVATVIRQWTSETYGTDICFMRYVRTTLNEWHVYFMI